MVQSIDGAMAEALSHLNRITCHLRKFDQHQAANDIGKLSIMIVNVFSEAIEKIPPTEYVLEDVTKAEGQRQASGNQLTVASQPSGCDTIQKQAVVALMNEVVKEGRENPNNENFAPQKVPAGNKLALQPGSWAQVASSYSNIQDHSQEDAHYLSPLSQTSCSASKSQNSDDEGEPRKERGEALSSSILPEIPEAKAGIIRIYGRISKDVIQFITTRIHEGPLQDIRVETNGRTRVVFQHASQALAFLKSNQEMEAMLGFGRFGCGYHVELAEVVDWNEDHRRMNQPARERRRLSFARKRLFAENISPEKWKQDIRTLAGPGNIDFLWVFNSGNATAVFTSTIVARKVLEVFNKWKDGRNVYNGVSVTFSSDPCEKELVLVRETNRPNIAKHFAKKSSAMITGILAAK